MSHERSPETGRPSERPHLRSGTTRSGWAAIGAAVAVAIGAGGSLQLVGASDDPASFEAVAPTRILDTRSGLGLDGPFSSPEPRVVQVAGEVATPDGPSVVVPQGASGVVLNVTVVEPTAAGFVSVRPNGTPGAPTTSNLNFGAGDIVPNAVTVALPPNGEIDIVYDAFGEVGPTTEVLVDITGYFVGHDHDDRYPRRDEVYLRNETYSRAEIDGALATRSGVLDARSSAESPPGFSSTTHEFRTDVDGRLVVMLSGSFEQQCDVGPAAYRIVVDTLVEGVGVTNREIESSEAVRTGGFDGTLHGVVDEVVPAGRHFVGVSSDCVSDAATPGSFIISPSRTNATLMVLP